MVICRSRKKPPTQKSFWIPDTCTAECTGHIWNPGHCQGVQGSGTTEALEKGASFAASREREERIVLKSAVHFQLGVTNRRWVHLRAAALLPETFSCGEVPAAVGTLGNLLLGYWGMLATLHPLSSWSSHLGINCTKTRSRLLISLRKKVKQGLWAPLKWHPAFGRLQVKWHFGTFVVR